MRTIDADALLEKVEKIQPLEPYLGKYAQGIRHCMEIVSLFIRDAPTIDPPAQPELARINDCNGCKFIGCYDTDFPCANCVRKDKDYYEPEG